MQHVTAVLSMLHEPPGVNSATRTFRHAPVLAWTLGRLAKARRVAAMVIVCWQDQLDAVEPIAAEQAADVLNRGERVPHAQLDAISAARRWADGWRGGLMSTCDFDTGYHAPSLAEIVERHGCDAVLLADPASALIDPVLIDGLAAHAEAHPTAELCFSQAAPGLSGAVIRVPLLQRLATVKTHPGKLLHYLPEHPCKDPIAGEGCAPVATSVARTTHRFKLDSSRQVARVTEAMIPLNGQLVRSEAEEIVRRMSVAPVQDPLPRELVLELTMRRATNAIFRPNRYLKIERPDLSLDVANAIFAECGRADDLRLTLAGVGDPLLAPNVFEVLEAAADRGIRSIHLETDLLGVTADTVRRLATSPIDVLTIHVPALTAETYAKVMGIDAYAAVLNNIRTLLTERQSRGRGVPLVVPTFTKCAANLAEMEPWYDQWLKALGTAVIAGPSTFAGQIPDVSVADMSPPRRRPCARLAGRMTILSDGRIVSCEQDVLGTQTLGVAAKAGIEDVWRKPFADLRDEHATGHWDVRPLCAGCTEWHRP